MQWKTGRSLWLNFRPWTFPAASFTSLPSVKFSHEENGDCKLAAKSTKNGSQKRTKFRGEGWHVAVRDFFGSVTRRPSQLYVLCDLYGYTLKFPRWVVHVFSVVRGSNPAPRPGSRVPGPGFPPSVSLRVAAGRRWVKKFRLYFCGVTNKKGALISTKGAKR